MKEGGCDELTQFHPYRDAFPAEKRASLFVLGALEQLEIPLDELARCDRARFPCGQSSRG